MRFNLIFKDTLHEKILYKKVGLGFLRNLIKGISISSDYDIQLHDERNLVVYCNNRKEILEWRIEEVA